MLHFIELLWFASNIKFIKYDQQKAKCKYEHCFSYNRQAVIGYHYSMRSAHIFNMLTQYSVCFAWYIKDMGARGAIRFIRQTTAVFVPNDERMKTLFSRPFRIRLLWLRQKKAETNPVFSKKTYQCVLKSILFSSLLYFLISIYPQK